jgi:hypothetical protein
MFRLIKLAVVLLVLHGVVRAGAVYWHFYQFQDALQDAAQFGETRTDKQLCAQVMDKAATMELPVAAEDVTVRRGANSPYNCDSGFKGAVPSAAASGSAAKLFIDASYTDEIPFLPGYRYPWEFKASVNAYIRP